MFQSQTAWVQILAQPGTKLCDLEANFLTT